MSSEKTKNYLEILESQALQMRSSVAGIDSRMGQVSHLLDQSLARVQTVMGRMKGLASKQDDFHQRVEKTSEKLAKCKLVLQRIC